MGKNTTEDFMAKRLSAQAAAAIDGAKECAVSLGHRYLGTEHLLAGMLRIRDSRAAKLLRRFNVEEDKVIAGIRDTIGIGNYQGELIGYTPLDNSTKRTPTFTSIRLSNAVARLSLSSKIALNSTSVSMIPVPS